MDGLYLLWTGIWPGMVLAMLIPAALLMVMSKSGLYHYEQLCQALAAATVRGMVLLIVVMMVVGFFAQATGDTNAGVGCMGRAPCQMVQPVEVRP